MCLYMRTRANSVCVLLLYLPGTGASFSNASFLYLLPSYTKNGFNRRQTGFGNRLRDKESLDEKEGGGKTERERKEGWVGFPSRPVPRIPSLSSGPRRPRSAQAHSNILTSASTHTHSPPPSCSWKQVPACLHTTRQRQGGKHFLETVANNMELGAHVSKEAGGNLLGFRSQTITKNTKLASHF